MKFYKYQGAGNDFLIADNRDGSIILDANQISSICDRHYGVGADGLMLLEEADGYDFRMVYYNSDGSGGMMCGNGGRCIVAFAADMGLPTWRFIAADGPHEAEILATEHLTRIVRLKMKDVDYVRKVAEGPYKGMFVDTGTRHFVMPIADIETVDVDAMGRRIRYDERLGPQGVNVNFIEGAGSVLKVRTYEKGVEAETYACGTGITASAIVAWHINEYSSQLSGDIERPLDLDFDLDRPDGKLHVPVRALRDCLEVEFMPTPTGAEDVYLIGPATKVAEVTICS